VLPLFRFKIPFGPKTLVSLPYCDVGDILFSREEVSNLLLSKAFSLIDEFGAKGFEVRSCKEHFPDRIIDNHRPISIKSDKVRMLLELPATTDDLWKGFKSKLRSQIKKTEKNGLEFSWGSEESIDDFYRVFSRNMRDLGSPVHSKQWLREIMRGYGENARIGMVYHNHTPIGGGIILCTKHCISIPWASTLREFNHLAPNMMLYWNFLKYASDSGRKLFDFGRSTPDEGTYRFKQQWGAKPAGLYWRQTGTSFGAWNSNDINSKRSFLESLWQKIPVSIANIIGPTVRKYISL
jgi:FemAB-related protein (PEP-CTERM system-associated)